jgi:antitoxin ParD1/3/4
MAGSVNLGGHLDGVIDVLVKTGRYGSRSEVLRAGVRLVHERESRLESFEAALAQGLADSDAGRVRDVDDVFDELEAEFALADPKEQAEIAAE